MLYLEKDLTNSIPIVNGIRRTLLTNIETYCLETTIIKNTTKINDDIIKHRISLIPIKDDIKVNFKCKNKTKDIINFTSSDFNNDDIMKEILISYIEPNETLEIECVSIKGSALEHSKFQTCNAYYFKNNDKLKLIIESDFIDVNVLYKKSIDYLLSKMEYYVEQIKNYKILPQLDDDMKCAFYKFPHESHTFGNIISSILRRSDDVTFAAYKQNHVLDDYIILNIKTEKDSNMILIDCLYKIISELKLL